MHKFDSLDDFQEILTFSVRYPEGQLAERKWGIMSILRLLIIGALSLALSACLNDKVSEQGTVAEIVPGENPRDPGTVVCDPFQEGGAETERTQGVVGQLYYLDNTQPQYRKVQEYFDFGHHVSEVDIFFNQLFIPTRPFDRGFTTESGQTITTVDGDTLYEWFALKFKGQIKLSPDDLPGDYQVALLSDDGSLWKLDRNNDGQMELVVDNDNFHSTRLGCATEKVSLQYGDKIPFEIDYFQGPRYHIALTALWRPWPENAADLNDPHCGMQSNSAYFDSTKSPPEPKRAYLDLLDRGWKPLSAKNFELPAEEGSNPCNEPTPVISNFAAVQVASNSVTFNWQTDVASTSQVVYTEVITGLNFETNVNTTMVTSHTLQVTGLKSNTLYSFKAKSSSVSGRGSESAVLTFKTSR